MRTWRAAALACLILVAVTLPALPALALLVQPILITLTSSGSGATGAIEVINDRNRPIAVEVTVNKLAVPERGEVVVTPDDGADFQIFPPIANIAPGARQVFRIRWIGEPNLPESKMFMFSTSELPVSTNPTAQSAVEVLYAIQSVVTVRPPQARADIAIAEVRRAEGRDGKKGVEIVFANQGPSHGFVNNADLKLRVEGVSWERDFGPAELNNVFGLGLVPPNARRAMFIPIEDLPPQGNVTARIQVAQARS